MRAVDLLRPAHQVLPGDRPFLQLEAPVRPAALGLVCPSLGLRKLERGAVVDRRTAGLALQPALQLQLLGGLIAGIEPAGGLQGLGRGTVAGKPGRLPLQLVPRKAEPGEILLDGGGEGLGRALGIGVVETQQEFAAGLPGMQPVEQGHARVADVQLAGRAGREAHLHETRTAP